MSDVRPADFSMAFLGASEPGPAPASPPRILVVDDDPYVARTLLGMLSQQGFQGTRAESGETALEKLAESSYDLVLLDVRMPGMNGFETCVRIRESHGAALPVIILTAFGDPASIRNGYDAGADDFLQKPIDGPHLILKVKAFLRMKSLHDEIDRSRREAQEQARSLALLHEIGRDWSLIAEPEAFHRMVTERLAGLIGAPICLIALYEPLTHTMRPALPVHGMTDEQARKVGYVVRPEYRSLWDFRTGRPYLSNRARQDPRLVQEVVQAAGAESILLVPMISESEVLGLLVAANKPGGFTESDVQLLTIFAGPAASFLRSRRIFDDQRRHARRLESVATLVGDMAAVGTRAELVSLAVQRTRADLGYDRVAFHGIASDRDADTFRLEAAAGERPAHLPLDTAWLGWALRGPSALQGTDREGFSELAVPVRAGGRPLGVLEVVRFAASPFSEEELNLLSAVAGQMAVAIQKSEGTSEAERLAQQMAVLYDLALETTALRDLRPLFIKAAEHAGRLIDADHTSVLRYDTSDESLKIFAAWARDGARENYATPIFRMGEGVAGGVARDRLPAIVNETADRTEFVSRPNPVARLLCVPLVYYEKDEHALFGVLNASRRPGTPPFTQDDLEYLTRFAGQLAIAVANSMAFAAERERSEQIAVVNAVMREISGTLSPERILETAVGRIHEAFQYPVVAISMADPDRTGHRVAASATRDGRALGGRFLMAEGIVGRAFRERRTQNVSDVVADPDYIGLVPSSRSEVAVPILWGDEAVAVLNVERDGLGGFTPSEVITLETLADGIGIVLRNAELYQALERTNAKLVELDRMKSELVNIVAHDFRAPLAGVLGHAELLEWRPDAPRADRLEQARAIIGAATHMANLVEKTLKTNRLETGQFPFEFAVVDLAAVAREVVARLPSRSTHPLIWDIPEDPVPCWADRDRVAEVLDNLISNAVKYSPAGGAVHLEVRREDERVVVSIRDQGLGIAEGDLDRLFRPFSRVRNLRTADIEGSGLGLYICDRIVRAHGGRLRVETAPEKGSVFSFTVPLFGAAAQTRPPMILVAAVDEQTRREVRRLADEQGYAVHEAMDGVEAVEAAMRLVPAAVVVDRVLPKLRAEEVAERLRANPATHRVPLFVLAAQAELGEEARLFDGFIPKPLSKNTLAAAIGGLGRGVGPA
ncbi:MAG TPA: GAF domain-containing protein [Vicinamibacteria bacterium]|nr:GAF domain-containing protein [Vicinamibacteria bacterium]